MNSLVKVNGDSRESRYRLNSLAIVVRVFQEGATSLHFHYGRSMIIPR